MSMALKFIRSIKARKEPPTTQLIGTSPPISVKAEVPSNNGNHPDRMTESEKEEK